MISGENEPEKMCTKFWAEPIPTSKRIFSRTVRTKKKCTKFWAEPILTPKRILLRIFRTKKRCTKFWAEPILASKRIVSRIIVGNYFYSVLIFLRFTWRILRHKTTSQNTFFVNFHHILRQTNIYFYSVLIFFRFIWRITRHKTTLKNSFLLIFVIFKGKKIRIFIQFWFFFRFSWNSIRHKTTLKTTFFVNFRHMWRQKNTSNWHKMTKKKTTWTLKISMVLVHLKKKIVYTRINNKI